MSYAEHISSCEICSATLPWTGLGPASDRPWTGPGRVYGERGTLRGRGQLSPGPDPSGRRQARQSDRHSGRWSDRQSDRWSDRQSDRWPDRWPDRRTSLR
ncbi:hypothetical protein DVH02_06510 [Streptomyces corynorhini]|uniref:Uncharacterized protein n=1 Tax=Streptomyces corynorhini TaxID=2282652 RepID=A0A370BBH6_9ACTN|nr:hypothetical protein DVH02_06510 [Streptomyces corynorhini]